MTLLSIFIACLIATVLAITTARLLDGRILFRLGDSLTCVSTGLLLALACTHLLPEAFEQASNPHAVGFTVWAGIFLLIFLEHAFGIHSHGAAQKDSRGQSLALRGIWPIIVGDSLHTFTDGLVIASSFLVSPALGWAITAGILMHEMPQEIGDFVLLRRQGLSQSRAYRLMLIAGASATAGGLLGYFVMDAVKWLLPYALALSGASFLYISMCELIPRLGAEISSRSDFLRQFLLIGLGAVIAFFIGHGH
ncbi:ZIP family metal transporter [Mesosutterella sp. OilRF-GAM-744-9]|uniref:ZIP family metal transporter n=1 Tax=Mesosutterella porci TaxID=2915351 RepID=A0ABS9MTJ9_9BURK|nr:ZIP family metal transporter [Mesosutterella sp. oilRF-744-WT-GAM-9]MCG5031946.1 ZIP family metal transporter [Mesosutterella sp. oilRF-744-WT-GAM-9]